MPKLEKLCRLAGIGGTLAALVMLPVLLVGTAAHAQTDTDAFYVNYFANAQLGTRTQDDIVRLIDTNIRGASESGTNSAPFPLCAMVYVFDEFQEMQECCGCPLSAGGRLDLSVDGLTFLPVNDFQTTDGAPTGGVSPSLLFRGTIKIVSTNSSITTLNPSAINGPCAGTNAVICDPTGDVFGYTPTPSLRAWSTHLQSTTQGYVTETRFEKADEPNSDLAVLEDICSSNRDRTNYLPNATVAQAAARGNCAAVCAAEGSNPYPGGHYGSAQLNFLESENGLPAPLCYTGF